MSISRVHSPNSDMMSKTSGDSRVTEKRSPRRAIPSTPVNKSKIPKHGPRNTPSTIKNLPTQTGHDDTSTVASEKSENHPVEAKVPSEAASPTKKPSKSQEKRPSSKVSSARGSISMNFMSSQKRVLENQFITKKKRYMSLKKDIEDKQKSSVSTYEELFHLREKILASGGKDPGKIEELLPLSLSARGRILEGGSENDGMGPTDDYITQLEANLKPICQNTYEFCSKALEKHNELIEWIASQDGSYGKGDWSRKLDSYREEYAESVDRLGAMHLEQMHVIGDLITQATNLWRENRLYRQERQHAQAQEETDSKENSEELARELRAEHDKLLKARSKIREQDSQLQGVEVKLRAAQEQVKQLEAQIKQKEISLQEKTRELVKWQKNSEITAHKQKENVDARVSRLTTELEIKDNELREKIKEYEKKLEATKKLVEEEKQKRQELKELKQKEYELKVQEWEAKYAKLEEKCKELLVVQEKRNADNIISDDHHTDYEIQLFNDLKETQRLLAEKEELIQTLQREKDDIISSVNEQDDAKLNAELVKKSTELQTLTNQFCQLQKNYKRMQEKADLLEQKMAGMSHLQTQMQKDGKRSNYGVQIMQLQQQLTDVRSTLSETLQQNTELEKTCTQLQLKLEHYKRYVRNQDQDLKVRLEMQQLLHHKDPTELQFMTTMPAPMYTSEEFQELYSALENKEMQILKLEQLVKQMERQEASLQEQRTRLENRIAKLELALKEVQQAQRIRGFSFL